MKLKGRLKLIADMLNRCEVLSDVGTDHAYIPVYAILNGLCKKAIAVDIRPGPLKKASDNILNFNLKNRIETRLGYGLDPLRMDELDTIVIAGMGGILIRDILKKDISKAVKAGTLILQPMKAPEVLRCWLYTEGFEITDEALCKEENRIYNAIKARWTGQSKIADEIDCFIGEKLIEKKDPLLKELTIKKIKYAESILAQLKKADCTNDDNFSIQQYYSRLLTKLQKILERL